MKILDTKIPEVKIIEPDVFGDHRGNVAAHALMAPAGQLVHDVVAQLTAHARYQYLHCL